MAYLARVRDELAAKGITSDKLELSTASSTSPSSSQPPSSSSSSSSLSRSIWHHVPLVTGAPSVLTASSVSATAAGGGGPALTSPSRLYSTVARLNAVPTTSSWSATTHVKLSYSSSSSASHPLSPAAGAQAVAGATASTHPSSTSALTSQRGSQLASSNVLGSFDYTSTSV